MRDVLENFEKNLHASMLPRVTFNGLSRKRNTPGLMAILYFVKRKRFVVTVLALFYESIRRGMKTKEIEK